MPSRVTWVTRKESVPLLENNPLIAEIIPLEDAAIRLRAEQFNLVASLDMDKMGAALGCIANGYESRGFLMHPSGALYASNAAAIEWWQMGLFDDVKKANKRTYGEIMANILGIKPGAPSLHLTAEECDWASKKMQNFRRPIVGLNTGASSRWQFKRWRSAGYSELAKALRYLDYSVVLLGGKDDQEFNNTINAYDTGVHDVRRYAALIGQCDVIVTSDTLGLHIATALGRKTVALFGPTSAAEVDVVGEKVLPKMDCLCCYKERCNLKPNCMDNITVNMVLDAVRRLNE
jgi:heptosyltransferase-2